MSNAEPSFPTFCHINEYGEVGYRNLHRMLAFSAPLNLWAPSSVLIRDCSQIGPKKFIEYVSDGLIRIQGREDWIKNREFRNSRPWSGAEWDAQLDDALLAICRDDEHEPVAARRVAVAAPAEGPARATEYLEKFPNQIESWNRIFHSRNVRSKIPAGILETVNRRSADGPVAVATAILGDAINHGVAIRDSGADVPLFLSRADKQFLKHLEESWETPGTKPAPGRTLPTDLAGQLLELLGHLDIHRGPRHLDRFLEGKGRRLMVAWLSDICQRYRDTNPRDVDSIVITELRSELGGSTFARPLQDALLHPIAGMGGLVGFVLAAADCVHDPTNAGAIAGMSAAVVQVAGGTAKQFGIVPSSYDGPQWPFLYAYNSLARQKHVRTLRYVLGEFRQGRVQS